MLYEGENNPLFVRKEQTLSVLSKAKITLNLTEMHKQRAEQLITFAIKPLDALHLSLAEVGNADYFCTCDDRLLHSAKRVKNLLVKVINSIDLVQEIEK